MDTFPATAADNFTAITGFSMAQSVAWATSTLKVFTAIPIVILNSLTGWIIAALMIAAIIFFAFAAMQFFRH